MKRFKAKCYADFQHTSVDQYIGISDSDGSMKFLSTNMFAEKYIEIIEDESPVYPYAIYNPEIDRNKLTQYLLEKLERENSHDDIIRSEFYTDWVYPPSSCHLHERREAPSHIVEPELRRQRGVVVPVLPRRVPDDEDVEEEEEEDVE